MIHTIYFLFPGNKDAFRTPHHWLNIWLLDAMIATRSIALVRQHGMHALSVSIILRSSWTRRARRAARCCTRAEGPCFFRHGGPVMEPVPWRVQRVLVFSDTSSPLWNWFRDSCPMSLFSPTLFPLRNAFFDTCAMSLLACDISTHGTRKHCGWRTRLDCPSD
jgi:hypothetical protein